uniref:R2D2 isoform a n=1 Tax=Mayetiola destructor TaxID=39758 RepID=K7Y657_MAYDE|nr:R2D2 isoform a [Mayetiola destructor]
MAEKTPVSVLQELCVQENASVPMYEPIQHESDPKMFAYVVEAFGFCAKGSGRSKREAKHEASANLLEILKQIDRFKSKFNVVPQTPRPSSETDAVGTLLDICVQRNWPIALFEEMQAYGEPHRPRFTIVCSLSSIQRTGTSTTKKSAKQLAAKAMLDVVQNISQNEELQQVATLDAEPTEKILKTYRELKKSDNKYTAIRLRDRHQYFRQLPAEDRNKAYDILMKDGAMTDSSQEIVDLTCRALNLKYQIKAIPDHPERVKAFILLGDYDCKRTNDRPGDLFILAALFNENNIKTRSADMNGVRVESATKEGAHIIAAPNSKYTGSFNVTFADENDI